MGPFFSFVGVSREETEGVGGCEEEEEEGSNVEEEAMGEDMKSLSSLYLLPPMPRLFIASSFSPL